MVDPFYLELSRGEHSQIPEIFKFSKPFNGFPSDPKYSLEILSLYQKIEYISESFDFSM